jgi:hypothetical protein
MGPRSLLQVPLRTVDPPLPRHPCLDDPFPHLCDGHLITASPVIT